MECPSEIIDTIARLAETHRPYNPEEEAIIASILRKPLRLEHCPNSLITEGLLTVVLNLDGLALKYAYGFKNNFEIVLQAVLHNPYAFEFASDDLKDNLFIVKTASMKNTYVLRFASEELRSDKDFMEIMIRHDGKSIQYASFELQKDAELVMLAVAQDGQALRFVRDEFKTDYNIVIQAIVNNRDALQYAYLSREQIRDYIENTYNASIWPKYKCLCKDSSRLNDVANISELVHNGFQIGVKRTVRNDETGQKVDVFNPLAHYESNKVYRLIFSFLNFQSKHTMKILNLCILNMY